MLEIDRPVVQATAPVRDRVPDGSVVTASERPGPASPLGSCRDLLKETLKILPSVSGPFVSSSSSPKLNYPIRIFAAGSSKCHSSL